MALRADRNADARRGHDFTLVKVEWRGNRRAQPIASANRVDGIADVFEQDDELVSTHAGQRTVGVESVPAGRRTGDRVLITKRRRNAFGQQDEQLIAGWMSEAVIDRLEPVQ